MLDKRFEVFSITVARINRYVQKIKEREMKELGLKGTHAMILYVLGKPQNAEGLTSTQICEACREDKAAISRGVSELTKKGFLCTNKTDDTRTYRTPIYLSDKGREIIDILNQKVDRVLNDVSEGLSDEERVEFYRALAIIEKNLEKISEE